MRLLPTIPSVLFVLAPFAFAQAPTVTVRDGRLLGSPATQQPGFGFDIALSGVTAVVGSPGLTQQPGGEARVFVRGATGWALEATLAPSDPADYAFGTSVAIEGDRLVVGTRGPQSVASIAGGALYVFERTGGQWTEVARLTGNGAVVSETLGFAVALQGNTIACGAPRDPHFGAGAAYVFARGVLGWTQQARLEPGDGEGFDYFGFALALDGDRVAVGARSDNHAWGANGGSVYVFERAPAGWAQVAKLVPADNAGGDEFGACLDLEGDALVVGAPLDDEPAKLDRGSLYVFHHGVLGWTQQQKLAPSGASAYDSFGAAVDVQGERLLVGSVYGANFAGSDAGAVSVFERAGGPFAPLFELVSTAAEQYAGFGAAVAQAGGLALVSAPYDDSLATGVDSGAVYTYRIEPAVATYCSAKVNSLGCVPAIAWSGVPSLSSAAAFDITAQDVLNQQNGALLYGYSASAAPFMGGTLCVAAPLRRLPPQSSGGSVGSTDCSGSYACDFNAYMSTGVDGELFAGAEVFAQFWSRDPASALPAGLTDALHFHIQP